MGYSLLTPSGRLILLSATDHGGLEIRPGVLRAVAHLDFRIETQAVLGVIGSVALGEQEWFLNWELTSKDKRNKYRKAGEHLRASRSAYAAGSIVSNEYEVPKDRSNAVSRGVSAAARSNVKVTIHNQTGSSVSTTVNAMSGG